MATFFTTNNATPFQDTNTLTALIFGNIKTDFQDDVRLHTDTKKRMFISQELASIMLFHANVF